MRPYKTIRLTEYPDVGDLRNEGRHGFRMTPQSRRAARRLLKRRDKRLARRGWAAEAAVTIMEVR